MRTLAIMILLSIAALTVCVHYEGGYVDMYETSQESHTYGWWPSVAKAIIKKEKPHKTLVIPIDNTTRNYIMNPGSVDMAKYLATCVVDSSKLTIGEYVSFMR